MTRGCVIRLLEPLERRGEALREVDARRPTQHLLRFADAEVLIDPQHLHRLVRPPRFHMLRYAGVLGPGAKLRHQVVPAKPAQSQRAPVQLTLVQAGQPVSQVQDDASTATRHPWSMLQFREVVAALETDERVIAR
jgi:hypothetical protein